MLIVISNIHIRAPPVLSVNKKTESERMIQIMYELKSGKYLVIKNTTVVFKEVPV